MGQNLKKILMCFMLVFSSFVAIVTINRCSVSPSSNEIDLLKKEFGDIKINSKNSILKIQNDVIASIRHDINESSPIDIKKILDDKFGQCFDRSVILQKIFIYNKIPVRPVYLYFNLNKKTRYSDFFARHINSHSVFEIKYYGKWYVIETNVLMTNLVSLDDYINTGRVVPSHARYIRNLSNRHGRFIAPSIIPDIYFFN